jgi:RNA recognition motif-containing protein
MRGSLPADFLSKNHGLESTLRMNIYVGNLAYSITDEDLREAFGEFGEVSRASVIMDRDTGRSKGFGFVEMPDNAQAEAAINGLNEKDLSGRPIRVNEAKPREDRPRRPRY